MADDGIAYVGDTSGDEYLDVKFYSKTVGDKEVDFVNIKVPGDKTLEIDEQVNDTHVRRFRRRWDMFKSMQSITGSPVIEWGDIPDGLKTEFQYLGFRYIEQIASAPDSAFSRIPGGTQWRVKAQAFLNRGKVSAEDMIRKQQAQIDALMAQMAALAGGEKPARGRKAKAPENE